jgi:serine/threonine protein kinase
MAANGFDDDQTRSFTNLAAGTIVSHYKIISKIGAGGMGEVYLAEDTQLDRKVALKFLPSHLSQDEAARARFTREAKASAKLDHPNIVQVFEVGEFQGSLFFVMAHIEGKSLREIIKEGKLSIKEAIEFTKQICEGLNRAHESGIVNRDIKDGNIIVDGDDQDGFDSRYGWIYVPGTDRGKESRSPL